VEEEQIQPMTHYCNRPVGVTFTVLWFYVGHTLTADV